MASAVAVWAAVLVAIMPSTSHAPAVSVVISTDTEEAAVEAAIETDVDWVASGVPCLVPLKAMAPSPASLLAAANVASMVYVPAPGKLASSM